MKSERRSMREEVQEKEWQVMKRISTTPSFFGCAPLRNAHNFLTHGVNQEFDRFGTLQAAKDETCGLVPCYMPRD